MLPRGDQAGVSLDFYHVWVGEDLYQTWCFIQNLHYGSAYTPHYKKFWVLKGAFPGYQWWIDFTPLTQKLKMMCDRMFDETELLE